MKPPPRVEGALRAHADGSAFTRRVLLPALRFIEVEEIAGAPLVLCAIGALVWANAPVATSYESAWGAEIELTAFGFARAASVREWINEILLPLLFFVAGLELKRELSHGSLSSPRRAAFPVAVALGGMVVPAAGYVALNLGTDGVMKGWGVPLATDIAFALAVLALVGPHVPNSLKTLVLAFAAVDDVGSVLVIAVFYGHGSSVAALAAAGGLLAAIVALNRGGVRQLMPYWILGAAMCAALSEGGVHPTVGAVCLGLLAPARPFFARPEMAEAAENLGARLTDFQERLRDDEIDDAEREALQHKQAETLGLLEAMAIGTEPVTERLSRQVNPWVSYAILPLFALANAGVRIDPDALTAALASPVAQGIVVGLVLGKPLGFVGFAWLATATGIGQKPSDLRWVDLVGTGLLAGIGFTVSLFIAELAFGHGGDRLAYAKMAVLAASILSGVLGFAVLRGSGAGRRRNGART